MSARKYETRKVEHKIALQLKTNLKELWRYVNVKINTTIGIGHLVVSINGGKITEDNPKANIFSDYFSSVFNDEDYIDNTNLKLKVVNVPLLIIMITE